MTDDKVRTALANARMVAAGEDDLAAVELLCDVTLDQEPASIASARLLATAHGVYEARIDGKPVGDEVLAPGWTSYEWRLAVQEHDVTELLRAAGPEPRIEVALGNGWWRGKLGCQKLRADYGEETGFVAALEIAYEDGSRQSVVTDADTWRARRSCVTSNLLYDGETIDARLGGVEEPLPVREVAFDHAALVAQTSPAVRRQETLATQRVWRTPVGRLMLDFGQNVTGWVRFAVEGPRGHELAVRYAEVLEHGEPCYRTLRHAKSIDRLVCSGEGADGFEPTLTFHGFRYVELIDWPGADETAAAVEAVVVHSDLCRTGWFECSDEAVNRLVENSCWGQRDNFLSVPTDCPQRDERLGWTGDIAVFAPTAAFQYDVSAFLGGWLEDLRAETEHAPGRMVPMIVPDLQKLTPDRLMVAPEMLGTPLAVWGDAAVWVPEALWHAYGDKGALASQYPAMVAHLESIEAKLSPSGLWDEGFQFADWLDPDAPAEDPGAAKADKGVVATACLYRSASFAARAAQELDKSEDAARWQALAERTRRAFNVAYVDRGLVKSDCQTVYALAIHFGLLDAADRDAAGARLARLVEEARCRVSTGFAGTPYVAWALAETGHVDEAYRLLLNHDCPGWLYAVDMGATTLWERWDSMLPTGEVNPGGMTSFNHYALGAVCDWVYQVVGGIRPASPGYASVLVAPKPGRGIDWAHCAHEAPCGRIEVSWRADVGAFELEVTIPEGVPATLELPDSSAMRVVGGHHLLGCPL